MTRSLIKGMKLYFIFLKFPEVSVGQGLTVVFDTYLRTFLLKLEKPEFPSFWIQILLFPSYICTSRLLIPIDINSLLFLCESIVSCCTVLRVFSCQHSMGFSASIDSFF